MLEIILIEVTPFPQNCRIIHDDSSTEAVVIDPGGEGDRIFAELQKRNLSCKEIWLTHSHLDHCGGVKRLKALTNAKLFGHPGEVDLRRNVERIAQFYGMFDSDMENCPEPDVLISGNETLSIGEFEFKLFFTPGHSPGHISFYHAPKDSASPGVLIAGDTLFAGSIGRTDLPGGNHELLMESIRNKIMTLPDSTRVLSGHGPDTTIGIERRTNPFLKD